MTSSSASLTATRGRTTLVVASSAAVAVLVVRYFQRRARARAQKSVERVKTLLPQNKPLVRTLCAKRNDTNVKMSYAEAFIGSSPKSGGAHTVSHSFICYPLRIPFLLMCFPLFRLTLKIPTSGHVLWVVPFVGLVNG